MCLICKHYFAIFQRLRRRRAHFFVSENTTLFATFRRLSVLDLCTKEYRLWPRLDSYHPDTGTSKFALGAARRRRPFFGMTMPANGQRKRKRKSIAVTRLPAAVPAALRPSVL